MSLKKLQSDPAAFRDSLLIDCGFDVCRLGSVVEPWQAADFASLDPAWAAVVSGRVPPDTRLRAWLERPRGHSKTSDLAAMATWALFASRRQISGIAAAADRDQAGILLEQIRKLCRLNPWLGSILDVQSSKVVNRHTGSCLEVISSDVGSSYGQLCDFVICDEVCHWDTRGEGLWASLLSTAAKRPCCLLLCISNAGFEDSWQFTLRETVRRDPAWLFTRLDGPQASWISPDILAEQKRLLPRAAYERLWLNRWASGSGDALESDLIDSAIRSGLGEVKKAARGWLYVGGLDLGVRHDASALVVIGKHVGSFSQPKTRPPVARPRVMETMRDLGLFEEHELPDEVTADRTWRAGSQRLQVAAVRIWKPSQSGGRVDLSLLESQILSVHARLGLSRLCCDPWQAEHLAQRLTAHGVPVESVPFVPSNLQSMALELLASFREGRIEIPQHEDLIADLRGLRVVEKSYGFRLESPRRNTGSGTRHGDAVAALSLALLAAARANPSARFANERQLVLFP